MTIILEFSADEEQSLQQLAAQQGKDVQAIALQAVKRLLPRPKPTPEEIAAANAELFSHTASLGYATGLDNEQIDADLGREYGDNHEPLPAPIHKNVAGAPLQEYQAFIDGLLEWPRVSVQARWAREWGNKPITSTYQTPAYFDIRMRQFTAEQRQIVADLMQEQHEGGLGTFLAYLEKWQLYRNNVPLAVEPYGTPSSYDLTCRMAGDFVARPGRGSAAHCLLDFCKRGSDE